MLPHRSEVAAAKPVNEAHGARNGGDNGEGEAADEKGMEARDGEEGAEEREGEVEALQALFLKMQAVKDMGSDLPEAERRKLAARAVREVMRSM